MRAAVIPMSVAFEVACKVAFAQSVSDPLADLRACSMMEPAERLECLDKLSRSLTPPRQAANDWAISETTSPVDYGPIVIATTQSREGAQGSPMQLSISCRAGRTELVVAGPTVAGKGEDYAISYRLDGNVPVQIAADSPSFGTGASFKGDVVRLLQSFPEEGDIAVRLSPPNGCYP